MNIIINDEQRALRPAITLSELLNELGYPQPGTALAVNQCVIPRDRWPTQTLNEGDELVIFQAIAGG